MPKKPNTLKKTEQVKKHVVYRTSSGKRVPGGSTLARVLSYTNVDSLMDWAVRMSEEGINFREYRKESANLGNCIHKRIETHFTGDHFPAESFPPIYTHKAEECLKSFLELIKKEKLSVVKEHCELAMVDDEGEYGGTIDLGLLDENSEPVLGDLKTSTGIYPDHLIQVAGFYRRLYSKKVGKDVRKVVLFRLDRDTAKGSAHWVPADLLPVCEEAAILARRAYELGKKLKRRI